MFPFSELDCFPLRESERKLTLVEWSTLYCMGCSRDVTGTEVYICHPKRDKGRECWRKVHEIRKSTGSDQ